MSKTLLIADDSMMIRVIIREAATKAGWTIVGEAADGQQAIDKYSEVRPDAVTLDLVMPQYDGLYALRGILGADPKAKILVVSALEQKNILREAFQIGAADFVIKPFDRGALLNALEQLAPQAHAAGSAT